MRLRQSDFRTQTHTLIMRIFVLLILVSMSVATQAQTTFSFTIPQNVATQDWVKQYVQRKIDSIQAAIPPVVTLPPCTEGPEIRSLTNISKDYLTLKFHGLNVTEIFWWVGSGDLAHPLRSGTVQPTDATLKLSYDTLPPGKYYFGIMGTKCSGSDTKEFTIK